MMQPPFIEQQAMTIWVTDAELIRRSGVPEKIMRQRLRAMDANPLSGFPKKDPLWGGRRHWPSVEKYWTERANKPPIEQRRRILPKRMLMRHSDPQGWT